MFFLVLSTGILLKLFLFNINSFSNLDDCKMWLDAWYMTPFPGCLGMRLHCTIVLTSRYTRLIIYASYDLLFLWLLTGVQVDTGAPIRPSSWRRQSRLKPTLLLCGSSTVTGGRSCILRYKHTQELSIGNMTPRPRLGVLVCYLENSRPVPVFMGVLL